MTSITAICVMYRAARWLFGLLHHYIYQCLGCVTMDHQSFNRVLPLLFDTPFIQRCWLCYYFHCVDILLINTWMDGWMDGWNENRQTDRLRAHRVLCVAVLMLQRIKIRLCIFETVSNFCTYFVIFLKLIICSSVLNVGRRTLNWIATTLRMT